MNSLFVYITAPDGTSARAMMKAVVEERLCACANILDGMESMYWWRGRMETGRESVCICKTTKGAYPALEKRLRELHPYETPCIVAWPLEHGFGPFLQWIEEETRS